MDELLVDLKSSLSSLKTAHHQTNLSIPTTNKYREIHKNNCQIRHLKSVINKLKLTRTVIRRYREKSSVELERERERAYRTAVVKPIFSPSKFPYYAIKAFYSQIFTFWPISKRLVHDITEATTCNKFFITQQCQNNFRRN